MGVCVSVHTTIRAHVFVSLMNVIRFCCCFASLLIFLSAVQFFALSLRTSRDHDYVN